MAKQRKTMDVEAIRVEANRLLALPSNPLTTDDFRKGVLVLLEHVLHATDNYKGFNLQSSEWLPEDERNYGRNGGPVKMLRDNHNDTRRVYY